MRKIGTNMYAEFHSDLTDKFLKQHKKNNNKGLTNSVHDRYHEH